MSSARQGGQEKQSVSFLVRVWREPEARGKGQIRCYLRNLESGNHLYASDLDELESFLHSQATAELEGSSSEEQSVQPAKAG